MNDTVERLNDSFRCKYNVMTYGGLTLNRQKAITDILKYYTFIWWKSIWFELHNSGLFDSKWKIDYNERGLLSITI